MYQSQKNFLNQPLWQSTKSDNVSMFYCSQLICYRQSHSSKGITKFAHKQAARRELRQAQLQSRPVRTVAKSTTS